MRTRLFIGVVTMAIVLAACGSKSKTTNASTTNTTRTTAPPTLAVQMQAIGQFGNVLTDGSGRTLYMFDKDATTKPNSACTGGCATNWPALMTSDGTGVGTGVDASMLSHNAANQYTFNGWPLYRFSGDTAPGDTNGQGVGGVWHIAGANGSPVMVAAASATTTTAGHPATTVAHTTATTAHSQSPAPTSPPATSPPATSPPATQPHMTPTTYGYPY